MDDADAPLSAKRSDVLAVDGHQHFWDPARLPLPWMTEEHAAIDRSFGPDELAPLMRSAGVEATILVQAACLDAETDSMFDHAARCEWIAAVIAWVPLDDPDRADERLDELASQPKLRGIRHLIHDEQDPHWIFQPPVLESLALLEERGLILELPVVFPRHLGDVPELARTFPQLTIVIDHLGKPPLGRESFGRWANELAAAAEHSNVAAKISGLNTATAAHDWDAAVLRPAVEVAVDAFGPGRLLCGSDWPMALLNGDYERVWRETRRVVDLAASPHAEAILAGTARRLYELDRVPVHVQAEDEDGAH
ncbi:MAG TPA: amidohydrolase family protein [Gaiellaceae bacterium]